MKYIYEYDSWPHFSWDTGLVAIPLQRVHYLQGKLSATLRALGFKQQGETKLASLSDSLLDSWRIEGEKLDPEKVRSSIARRLGIEIGSPVPVDSHIDGVVQMTLDAVGNYAAPVTDDRLFGWHAALFPTGRSGMYKIIVGAYRQDIMRIVSGALGKETIHYEAPPPERVPGEMARLLHWINHGEALDGVIKAAIAHLWFIIIHPFEDGNGRIARSLTDLLLARSEEKGEIYYSLSSQINRERRAYYNALQQVQVSGGDITEWLRWFLACLTRALEEAENRLQGGIDKIRFWQSQDTTELNERQRLVLNRLLDGFVGKMQTSKWAKIAKCSTDTALRDIQDLVSKGILLPSPSKGRGTSYEINIQGSSDTSSSG